MQLLVSIIMPAYNCEKYITQAINSVIAQTYCHFELIIIDDCSNDKTVGIMKKMCKSDSRIKTVFNKRNIGVAATRSRGVSLANGEWIAFIDSDDCWEKNKLEKQLACIAINNAEFVFTGSSFIDELSNPYKSIFEVPNTVNYKQLLKQNVISCSSVLIKKRYMEMFSMDNDNTHEDYGAWLRILKTIPFAYGVNEPLLIYRITSTSKSGNKLKSLIMAYRTYRYIGLNVIYSSYYMCWYIVRGIRKYKKIK
ncbi:glycosyltransferase family 2 protein [Paenibacillus tritici]|uniref:glycosyltransferase family 2 protein n=1 Tax=Paenibacillus tritici TaxID=1873425 RepID=UPI001BA52D75|nr:glycosyltransferase family 2 protein [Paenibacillus tritici]QUL53905.1 glycosyltransferase family 2 protein [Paenibacillus tritici]